jgi:hypothetical protein
MKKFLIGLAVTPLLCGAALAQPAQLSESQMDWVTAGFHMAELDNSNTSTSAITIGLGPIVCQTCYLNIQSTAVTVVSNFGQTIVGMPVATPPNNFPFGCCTGGGGGGGLGGGND